jgi:hypothetical protein
VLARAPDASPLWARFYELDTTRPFMANRDGKKVYSLAEVERERRNGLPLVRPLRDRALGERVPGMESRARRQRHPLSFASRSQELPQEAPVATCFVLAVGTPRGGFRTVPMRTPSPRARFVPSRTILIGMA